MNAYSDGQFPRTALLWFAARQIPPRIDAFEQEIPGVRQAEDIEYIHRMRVASRRLRAALPLFRECFAKKQYLRWMLEIANITRALGKARDADVQIAFLQKQLKKGSAKKSAGTSGQAPAGRPEALALRYLLAELKKKRQQQQERVILALDALDKSRVIPEMREFFLEVSESMRRTPSRALMYGIAPAAAIHIESRLTALLSYDPWVSHPEAVAEHHATRIAAKKLRYTLEVFGPLYRLGMRKTLARVRKIQEILGDIHDCDVWIDHIARIILRERSLLRTENEEKRPDTATLASLRALLAERERRRSALFRRFVRYWEAQKRSGLWAGTERAAASGQKTRFRPHGPCTIEEGRAKVAELSAACPEVIGHSTTVTNLALMLFDSLLPLHGLGARERFLLECSGMLHDIGWIRSQKRHNRRGARIIMESETLPFDLPERIVISIAACTHRGRVLPEQTATFRLLSEKDRATARYLSAILRVADGFDYPGLGAVREVHCVIGEDRILADAVSSSDITIEKEHARMKSDLLVKVFSRELVIR